MPNKVKISKSEFNNMVAEIIIEEGHFSDEMLNEEKTLSEEVEVDREIEIPKETGGEENAPISDKETLALKSRAIKDGIVQWFKDFKVKEDSIQLKHGNKAVISDGSGGSYIILFKVNSWNPPAVEIEEMQKVKVEQSDDLPDEL